MTYKPIYFSPDVIGGYQTDATGMSGYSSPPNINYPGSTKPTPTTKPTNPPSDYGKFLNLPAGSKVDRAFRDSDKDGIDDRYQSGPGQPRGGSQSQPASSTESASAPLKTLRKPRRRRNAMMARPWLNSLAA
jgi:hypothetical protein